MARTDPRVYPLTRVCKHGHSYRGKVSPVYRAWCCMRTRCYNPNTSKYRDYGGRGIVICKRWDVFLNFLADMGKKPKGTSLDRFPDNNGDYRPGNCRWATPKEQANNQRVRKRQRNARGVYFIPTNTNRPWIAKFSADNKIVTVGYFHSQKEARRAYKKALGELECL